MFLGNKQCYGSWIVIPDPDFFSFFKIKNYFNSEQVQKKNLSHYSKFYPKKYYLTLKNMGLGSEIRKKPIPNLDPGIKKRYRISGSTTLDSFLTQQSVDPPPT
jgi:hypothetical protein